MFFNTAHREHIRYTVLLHAVQWAAAYTFPWDLLQLKICIKVRSQWRLGKSCSVASLSEEIESVIVICVVKPDQIGLLSSAWRPRWKLYILRSCNLLSSSSTTRARASFTRRYYKLIREWERVKLCYILFLLLGSNVNFDYILFNIGCCALSRLLLRLPLEVIVVGLVVLAIVCGLKEVV